MAKSQSTSRAQMRAVGSNSRSLNRDTAYSAHYAMGSLEVNILLEPRG